MTSGEAYSCEEVFRRLDDYVDRELSPDEIDRVEEHLATCAECAGEARFESELVRELKAKLGRLRVPSVAIAEIEAMLRSGGS